MNNYVYLQVFYLLHIRLPYSEATLHGNSTDKSTRGLHVTTHKPSTLAVDNGNLTYFSFKKIRNSPEYVDKTHFIKWIFSPSCARYQVILAPSKFGKSTNFAMLREFLHPAHYGHSDSIKSRQEKLFQNLEIMKDTKFVAKHLMKHPVMYLDFTPFNINPAHFQDDLADLLRRASDPIRTMTSGKENLDKALFANITWRIDANWSRPSDGRALSFAYNQVYNGPIIVLIDGLNALLSRSWVMEEIMPGHVSLVVEAIGSYLFEGIFRNPNVEKILMTGRTRIAGPWKEFIADLQYTNIFDDAELASCFGFSEFDVRRIGAGVYGLTDYTLNGIKQWFDGYSVVSGEKRISWMSSRKLGLGTRS
ncbi:uncharacterized protein [Bemisia tabaci]|uniref:uncharacterized protein isoform X2 n=1 Tax=Bemisia tabaci TaxID=7038 RepID=UPI003B27E466